MNEDSMAIILQWMVFFILITCQFDIELTTSEEIGFLSLWLNWFCFSGTFCRRQGQIYMDMTFSNKAMQAMAAFAIQFNKNRLESNSLTWRIYKVSSWAALLNKQRNLSCDKTLRALRARGKCRKHKRYVSVFYISLVFCNSHCGLSQCNTRLMLLHLLYEIYFVHEQNNETRFFYVLYSDKTNINQSVRGALSTF